MSSSENLSEKLSQILASEYAALLAGDLTKIAETGADKVQVLESIGAILPEKIEAFTHLREKLIRNQLLTQSAIAGMRKAILRTKEVDDVTTVLRTYGADGKKSGVAMKSGQSLSKRS